MLTYKDLNPSTKAFVFSLDNVLYPEGDYLLQVYYLFSNFIEFTEGFPNASDLTDFFKNAYLNHGHEGIFDRAKDAFGIDEKYRDNFIRLHSTARLPLKLLLYPNVLRLLQDITMDRKEIIILTNGRPETQVNKIMQTEWNGLEKYLKVYYVKEIVPELELDAISYVLKQLNLQEPEILIIGPEETDKEFTKSVVIDYLNIKEFI
jgi:FMN phosphatase YigB (HAD superfamily)